MGWGIHVTGTRAGVKKEVAAQFDVWIAKCVGEEARDVAALRDRAVAIVDALRLDKPFNAVTVIADGSHHISGENGEVHLMGAGMRLEVTRAILALDEAPAPAPPDPSPTRPPPPRIVPAPPKESKPLAPTRSAGSTVSRMPAKAKRR